MPESSVPTAVESTARLRGVLERVGDALANAHLEGLLDAESELSGALGQLSASPRPAPADLHAITVEIGRTRASLVRCRRLGSALVEVARMAAQAHGGGYGKDGHERRPVPGPALAARA